MSESKRDISEVEKPGRLQLAILEWQRQLLAKRAATGEPSVREQRSAGLAG